MYLYWWPDAEEELTNPTDIFQDGDHLLLRLRAGRREDPPPAAEEAQDPRDDAFLPRSDVLLNLLRFWHSLNVEGEHDGRIQFLQEGLDDLGEMVSVEQAAFLQQIVEDAGRAAQEAMAGHPNPASPPVPYCSPSGVQVEASGEAGAAMDEDEHFWWNATVTFLGGDIDSDLRDMWYACNIEDSDSDNERTEPPRILRPRGGGLTAELTSAEVEEIIGLLELVSFDGGQRYKRDVVQGDASIVLGCVRFGNVSTSTTEAEHNVAAAKKLNEIMKRYAEPCGLQYWTSITLNLNTVSTWHKDVSNHGNSSIMIFGNFTSGGSSWLRIKTARRGKSMCTTRCSSSTARRSTAVRRTAVRKC